MSSTTRYIVAAAALGAMLLLGAFGVLGVPQRVPETAAAAATPADPAAAPSFVIRAKTVYPVTAADTGPLSPGTIIVRNGRIEAVGTDLDIPADLPVIDLPDEIVCPGFVSAGSALAGRHSGDESVSGFYRALDAFDTYDDYRTTVARGTTTVHLDPGEHRLVSGLGAVVKLAGAPEQRVLVPEADLTITLGTFDPPPLYEPPFYASSDVAIEPAQRQRPDSRLGQFLELEERIAAANATAADPAAARAEFDAHASAFAQAWNADLPLRFHVRRAADIAGALRFIAEQGRLAYLVGLTEAGRLPEALWAARVPVVVRIEETYEHPGWNIGRHPDALAPALDTASRLAPGPLAIALAGRSGDTDEDLRMAARLAIRGGMPPQQALAAITRTPAEILGVDERVGSLAPGRDADLLVLTGAPLDISSHVHRVYVGGHLVFEAPPPEALVIKAGTVWVGDGTVVQNGAVLIENGRIQAVGHRVPHPPRARVIDAGPGGFLTPGFIDGLGHLGLEGDRSGAGPDMKLHRAIAVAGPDFLRVARAGVTTVLLAPYACADNGARMAAIKTYGPGRSDLVARELTGLRFSLRGGDPLTCLDSLRGALATARKYDEKWKKYQEELAKWEKARAEGKTTGPKEKVETVVEGETKVDPITGKWEVTLSGDPLPEAVTTTMTLKLTGNTIEGRIVEPGGSEETELSGTLDGKEVTLEVHAPDSPVGNPTVKATLDREDHMTGKLIVANYEINAEATRTDKSDVEFKVTRRRQRSKDGRPLPPQVDESLEPYRPLLAGKIPAVVQVQTANEIAAAITLFVEENKLPLVLLGADNAADVMDRLVACKDKLGVVVPPMLPAERQRRPYWPMIDLSRHGIPVALRSDGEDRARNLPLMGFYAVAEGLGGDAALRALTSDAAKMYHLDDRLGTLQPGRDADVLIFQGHPFDTGSRLERVVISGREVPHEK